MKTKLKEKSRFTKFKNIKNHHYKNYTHTNKFNKIIKTNKKTKKKQKISNRTTKLNYLKKLLYPIPLLKHSIIEQNIKNLINYESLNNTQDNNWKIIYNKSKKYNSLKSITSASSKLKNTNKTIIILKYNYTSNDFDIVYKIDKLNPSIIYYIQEEYLLQKSNILAYNNFLTIWNKNNTFFFNDIITHNMPYFDAKYELANKYNYFLKYIYPIDIYIDINKNILENIIQMRHAQLNNNLINKNMALDINIFSPYMDEGNILLSFLKLQNMFNKKINMHFQGCTLNKICFDGYNNLLNLFNIEKKTINNDKYYDNYIQNSFKNNFDLFNGVYPMKNLKINTLDLIEILLPNVDELIKTNSYINNIKLKQLNYSALNKDIALNNIFDMFKLLKYGGYIVILIENLTNKIIDLLNNIMKYNDKSKNTSYFFQNIDNNFNIEFIRSIRITRYQKIDEHDNFIFIFKKNI